MPYSTIAWFAALSPPSWSKTLDKEWLNAFPNTPVLPTRGLKPTTGKLSVYIKNGRTGGIQAFKQINRLTIKLSFTIIIHLTRTLCLSSIDPLSSGRPLGRLQNNAPVPDGPCLWVDSSSQHRWPSSSPRMFWLGQKPSAHPQCTMIASQHWYAAPHQQASAPNRNSNSEQAWLATTGLRHPSWQRRISYEVRPIGTSVHWATEGALMRQTEGNVP